MRNNTATTVPSNIYRRWFRDNIRYDGRADASQIVYRDRRPAISRRPNVVIGQLVPGGPDGSGLSRRQPDQGADIAADANRDRAHDEP